MTPDLDLLYHLSLRSDWERAQAGGVYEMSTIGMTFAEVGFVHASFTHQVRATADRFYAGRDDVILLSIDPARLPSHPVVEAMEGSDEGFPHLFSPLAVDAVVGVGPVGCAADGRLDVTDFDTPTQLSFDVGRLMGVDAEAAAGVNSRSSVAGFGHVFPAETAPPTRGFLTDLWLRWLEDPERVGHAARTPEGRLIGVGISGRDSDDSAAGHLSKIYVEPWFWRLGVARALYDVCLGDLRSRGFGRVTLHVLAGNRRARQWYERLGWVESGRPIDQVHGHVLEIEYELALA